MPVYCSLHHENPDGSAFCDECGEPLSGTTPSPAAVDNQPAPGPVTTAGTQTCPSCGAQNPAGEAYCANCGVSLLGTPAPAAVGTNAATVMPPAAAPAAQEPAVAPAAPSAMPAAPTAMSARLIE